MQRMLLLLLLTATYVHAGVDMKEMVTPGSPTHKSSKHKNSTSSTAPAMSQTSKSVNHEETAPFIGMRPVTAADFDQYGCPIGGKVYTSDYNTPLAPERVLVMTRPVVPLATGTKHMLVPTPEQLEKRDVQPVKLPVSTTLLVYRDDNPNKVVP